MTRATLVAATLCVFASAGSVLAQDAAKPAEVAPIIAAVSAPTLAPALTPTASPVVDATVEPSKPTPPPVTLVAKIDLTTQRLTVTENGKAKYTWPISSGAAGFETPTGNFKPQWSAKLWHSRKYDMAPMPHAVFFNGGIATHATQSIGMLGRPASHGCIRLSPTNAAIFYGLVQRHSMAQTRIHVSGSPRFNKPSNDAIASRNERQPMRPRYAAYSSGSGSAFFSGPVPQVQYSQSQYRPVQYRPVQHAPVQYRQVRYVPTAYRY